MPSAQKYAASIFQAWQVVGTRSEMGEKQNENETKWNDIYLYFFKTDFLAVHSRPFYFMNLYYDICLYFCSTPGFSKQ